MKDRNSNNQSVILYVEGQDQFRGWFNSSLITSVIINNSPPFQQVLSHGFVVDEKGKKMSKSLGNVIDTKEIIEKFGDDVLRIWVFSRVFSKDSLYCDSLKSLRRKQIITTFYYLLSNLLKIISPVLPFLAEEIYQNLPFNFGFADQKSIFLVTKKTTFNLSKEITEKIKIIPEFLFFRQDIFQTLEKARQEKIIETNSQAKITIYPKNKNC